LRGAVSKFDYLQQGIAIVLAFIGLKMLGQDLINKWVPNKTIQVVISLSVILICLAGSIFYSIFMKKKGVPPDIETGSRDVY
jgi:tellurite resistance protein TerC